MPTKVEHIHQLLSKTDSLFTQQNMTQAFDLAKQSIVFSEQDFERTVQQLNKALEHCRVKGDRVNEIKALCLLSQLHISQNAFTDALKYAECCIPIIGDLGREMDKALLAEVYHQLSLSYAKKQEYTRLQELCESLLSLSRELGDEEKELSSLQHLAVFYGSRSDYKQAMQYLLEALEKSRKLGHRKAIADCLINIGTIYANLYNHAEALDRYEIVLKEYADILDENTLVIVYNNVGNIQYSNDRPDLAYLYFENALQLAQSRNYRVMVARSLAQLSRTNLARKNNELAFEQAQQADQLFTELGGDVPGKQINLINLGHIFYNRKDYAKANLWLSRGIVTAKRLKDVLNEVRGYQLLSKVYEDQGDYTKAFQFLRIYTNAQDEFAKEQRNRQVIDMEIKFAIRDKQQEIEQLTRENEYQSLLLEQSDQIANQNAQLLQANEELRQFAYVASHDLKEPLRMIGSYTGLIAKLHQKDFPKDTQQYFSYVTEGVTRMNGLLDALLRYATIGKTEEDLQPVQVTDTVEIALINLRVRVEETNATVAFSNLPMVHSSQSLLIQLFQNLISNALKFSKPDTKPYINIDSIETEEEYHIRIKDNGIGISEEHQKQIFIIFQRLHARTEYEGTGIGLAICQKIVQRLGGRIWVESEPDAGATFIFSLPKK